MARCMPRVGVKRARASRSHTIHYKMNDDVCGFHPVLYATLLASHLLLFFKRPWIQCFKGFHVICYLDDILITGNDKEHLYTLATVLQRLQQYGFHLKCEKCEFLQQLVEYLGHRIDSEGLHAIPSKLHAITQAPAPPFFGTPAPRILGYSAPPFQFS